MNEKLQKICEEILKNENESKKFIALQTPEEMYDYFKEKMPELTEDEFDSFVVEALDSYIQIQNQEPESISDTLDIVSGGVNLGKFSKQMVAGAMAALSMSSAAMASNTQTTTFGSNINTVSTQNEVKSASKFKKITNWIKNHKALSTLIGAGILIGGTLAVKHFIIDRKPDEKENSQTEIPKTGDPKLDEKIKKAFKEIDDTRLEIEKAVNDAIDDVNSTFHEINPTVENVIQNKDGVWVFVNSDGETVDRLDTSASPDDNAEHIATFNQVVHKHILNLTWVYAIHGSLKINFDELFEIVKALASEKLDEPNKGESDKDKAKKALCEQLQTDIDKQLKKVNKTINCRNEILVLLSKQLYKNTFNPKKMETFSYPTES